MRWLVSFLYFIVVVAIVIILIGWLFMTDFFIFDILLMFGLYIIQLLFALFVIILVIWIIKELFN